MGTDKKITRRSALRRMGAMVVSAVAASSGLLSMVSCEEKSRKRAVLCFTGTGNCLYVARQLPGKDGEVMSIPQLMKRGGDMGRHSPTGGQRLRLHRHADNGRQLAAELRHERADKD